MFEIVNNFINRYHLKAPLIVICGVGALILIVIIREYIRFIYKRIKLFFTIKNSDAQIYPTHKFWMFGMQRNTECDFYFSKNEILFSVKLCGSVWRASKVALVSENTWLREFQFMLLGSGFAVPTSALLGLGYATKKIPRFDFEYAMPEHLSELNKVNLLLFYPASVSMVASSENYAPQIRPFEKLFNYRVIDGNSLKSLMNESYSPQFYKDLIL